MVEEGSEASFILRKGLGFDVFIYKYELLLLICKRIYIPEIFFKNILNIMTASSHSILKKIKERERPRDVFSPKKALRKDYRL